VATRPRSITADKRTETRMLCSELVGIKWTNGAKSARECLGVLEDISTCGACLRLEQPIPVQTPVRVIYGGGHLQGVVRYCVFRAVGYFVGVQFSADARWSDARYRPEHTTDVRDLLNRSLRRSRAQERGTRRTSSSRTA